MKSTLTALIMTMSMSAVAQAQGFNCRDSRRADEATICQSPELSRLDRRLNAAYYRALRHTGRYEASQIRADQRRWLARRAACGIRENCLERAYRQRLDDLN